MNGTEQTPVVHCKKESYDIYIGRPGPWRNPFSHSPSRFANVIRVASREEAIRRYRNWFWQQIKNGRITLEEVAGLHGKTLGCWCSPQSCHGDVLAKAADWAHDKLEETQPR